MVTGVLAELQRGHHTMLCETKKSLYGEWREAAMAYTATVAELTSEVGSRPTSELFKIATNMEVTRRLTGQARGEFDRHIAEHCC